VVRRDTGEVVVNRSLMSLEHNRQLQLVIEARDRGMLLVELNCQLYQICTTSTNTL